MAKFNVGDVVYGDWNCNGKWTRHKITKVGSDSSMRFQSGAAYQCQPDLNSRTWGHWYDEAWFISEVEFMKTIDSELPW